MQRAQDDNTQPPEQATHAKVEAASSQAIQAARSALGSAMISAALAVVASLIARLLFAVPTSAEVFGDQITRLIPLPLFEQLLQTFGGNAKHLYYASVLVGEAIITALIGVAYWSARQWLLDRQEGETQQVVSRAPSMLDGLALIVLLWLLSAGIFAPLVGGGLLGNGLAGGAVNVLVAQAIPDAVFALVFVVSLRRHFAQQLARSDEPGDVTRRRVLRQAGMALAVLAGGALIWEGISSGLGSLLGINGPAHPTLRLSATPKRIVPPPTPSYGPWAPVSGQTAEITPVANFYYVSKNLVGDPQVDQHGWRLQISGLVNKPYTLSYSDLLALPQVEQYHTLECISNEVGGNLMSNALWTGVSLADTLNRAVIQAGASELIFHGADGYSDRLHLSQALDARSLIAYRINGTALPIPHGFPARLLIPGLYGMKNGKWLTGLELSSGDYTGYWEQQGWTREAHVKPTARIDLPHDGDLLIARPMYIAGVAYSGANGIARVEISTDCGQTWQATNLKRPLGVLTWVLWEYRWTPQAGQYIIAARCIDLDGNVQISDQAPPLPTGASGYDAVQVTVR